MSRRARSLQLFFLAAVALAGCSGGDSGPTGPVTLFGSWQGQMTATRADAGAQMTCSLTLQLNDIAYPVHDIDAGPWRVSGADGTMGGSTTIATRFVFDLVTVLAVGGRPFSGCAWNSAPELTSGRMRGDWSSASDCPVAWSGRIDLRLAG